MKITRTIDYNEFPSLGVKIDKASDRECYNIARKVRTEARKLCPVGDWTFRNNPTGVHMRDTIEVVRSSSRFAGGGWECTVGAYYAPFVELGTRYMRAQPFMGPAARKITDHKVTTVFL